MLAEAEGVFRVDRYPDVDGHDRFLLFESRLIVPPDVDRRGPARDGVFRLIGEAMKGPGSVERDLRGRVAAGREGQTESEQGNPRPTTRHDLGFQSFRPA